MSKIRSTLGRLPRSGRALAAGFVALGLFLLASVLFSLPQQGDDALLRHALEVEVDLGDLRSALLGAEVGQRSYLLTGRQEFLAPYRDASTQLDDLIGRLARAVRQDAGQDALFERLPGALRAVRSQAGPELMNDIHQLVVRMDEEQDRLVIERQDAMGRIETATSVTTAVSLAIGLARPRLGQVFPAVTYR